MKKLRILILPTLMFLNLNCLIPPGAGFYRVALFSQLLLFGSLAYFHWSQNKQYFSLKGCFWIAAIYILAAFKGFSDGSINATELVYTTLLLFCMAIIAASVAIAGIRDEKVLSAFLLSISAYVAVCVFIYILGIRPTVDIYAFNNESRMGEWLGIDQRIYFPFTPGINSFGSIVGMSIVSIIACLIFNLSNRKLLVILLFFSIAAIIGVDSRGPLIYSMLAFPLGYFAYNNFKLFTSITLAISVLVVWVIKNVDILLGFTADMMDALTGRPLIWLTAINDLEDLSLKHFFGYGMYGQVVSEVSYDYANLFSAYDMEYPERNSLHNFTLQSIFDVGILGYLVIMGLVFVSLYEFAKCKCAYCKTFTFILMYLLLCGLTEPVPTVYSMSTLIVFLVSISYRHARNIVRT